MLPTFCRRLASRSSFLLIGVLASLCSVAASPRGDADDWPTVGGDLAGQHFSRRTQIDRGNVHNLRLAWTFHTGALREPGLTNPRSNFETSLVLWDGRLYFDTPYDQVIAIDAETGEKRWSFDPKVSHDTPFDIVASRGVALWHSSSGGKPRGCATDRVFVATLDRRLIAVDALSGQLCRDFGSDGSVDLAQSLHIHDTRWYSFTSPPTILGDVVAVGSSVGDNQLVEAPSGAVRGFDARTGKLLWTFEPLPWAQAAKQRSGSGGAWSVMSADPQLGLLFVPTGSPSVDFYGANRPGDDRDANSVIALDAKTGRKIWAFQVVHHDLWDLDVAAEPLLFTFRGQTPAVAVTTKMGMTFVLDRRNGQPIFPVEERNVPTSDVPGEQAAPTQPFSTLPLLAPMTLDVSDITELDHAETIYCRRKIASLANKGVYTPVGLTPTLLYPGSLGGVNWGSAALDPESAVLYANVNRFAFETRLVPRQTPPQTLASRMATLVEEATDYWREMLWPHNAMTTSTYQPPDSAGFELSSQEGTPYKIYRAPVLSPSGLPCTPGPWGAVVALDLNRGVKLWTAPLGTVIPGRHSGAVTVGGPIVTATGLVFTGGGSDPLLYAFDSQTGHELWRGTLPAAAQATPMSYQYKGRQYVVIAAGGHGSLAPQLGDAIVAFSLQTASP